MANTYQAAKTKQDEEIALLRDLRVLPDGLTSGVATVFLATAITWLFLVGGSALLMLGITQHVLKDTFVELATKIVLPVYNSTIVAALSYVFGKPAVTSLAKRWSKT